MRPILAIILFVFVANLAPIQAQPKAEQNDPFQHPFANPVDKPGLPRVLIVGDSISIGYTPRVRRLLDGVANVHRPKTNCRWSAYGDENIEEWVGDSKWDVIHFNFGLWDWYGWRQDVKATPESYAKCLESIILKIRKKSDAKLIFGITTPPCIVEERNAHIVVSEDRAKEFNRAARAVMEKHKVGINNLYDLIIKRRAELQRAENDVHYNDQGRDILAQRVASRIRRELGKKTAKAATSDKPIRSAASAGTEQAPGRPNFVFFLVDDLGRQDLGCYGSSFHETPRVDQLAKEGVRFTDAYAASLVC